MLRIKLTINETGVYLSGMYLDSNGSKYSINRQFQSEHNALETIETMRANDCEFSLSVIRKV